MATLLQLCQPFDHAVMAVIQQLSGAMMDKIMLVFTFLGEETFAILLLIAVYWCWDRRISPVLPLHCHEPQRPAQGYHLPSPPVFE